MKFTKIVFSALLTSVMLLGACVPATTPNGDDTDDGPTSAETTATVPNGDDTTAETTEVTTPIDTEKEPPETLKILAIGNSFSTDSMQYLYQIAKAGGVKNIILGNLYYGGCSIQQHLSFAKANNPIYKYYKNTTGSWNVTDNYKMETAIADEDWDYISLQQTSKTCGLRSSYGNDLTALIDYVRSKNTTAKLIWNMTWAYQQDSTHTSFPNYDKSQTKMYEMIIDCVENCIETEERFDLIIPCMTSIQNARTSFLGDTLTRDGYHLDYGIGRYIAGLTWFAAITQSSFDDIKYVPSTLLINDDMLAVAKESVKNAMADPKKVTQSKLTEGSRPQSENTTVASDVVLDPADFIEADKTLAASNGVDLSNYTQLKWNYIANSYYNCTSRAGTTTPSAGASTYNQNVCSDKKYSLTELPLGSVFICDAGWQYRLDIFTDANAKYTAGSRPGMIVDNFYVLAETLGPNFNYVAWNIASNPKSDISAIWAQAAAHVRVYVPNTNN